MKSKWSHSHRVNDQTESRIGKWGNIQRETYTRLYVYSFYLLIYISYDQYNYEKSIWTTII